MNAATPFAGYPALAPGGLVGVIAPAGPADAERVAQLPALYERYGFRCRIYPGCHQRSGYLAGSDEARLADLHAALADDEVAALHSLRGGYGCMRLLDRIDRRLLRRTPKLLVGYSDLTALHALWARHGWPSLHAPMPASDLLLPGREADAEALFTLLQEGLPAGSVLAPVLEPSPLNRAGRAEGRLIGGNLSLVAALLGTPWAWQPEGALLFLEDVNEDLYRVDRLLTQLRLAGVLDAVAGFVLGSFTEATAPTALLEQMLMPLGKPLLAGWPSGHGTPNRPLPLGLRAVLDAGAGTLTLSETLLQAKMPA
jgi:muramoyltetrapeptide carboxypeptidase